MTTLEFLQAAARAAALDVKAHKMAHRGRFRGTLACHMDVAGECHGSGENLVKWADEATRVYLAALEGGAYGAGALPE